MIALSIGATSVAHGVHYAVVGVGVLGLLALLGPQLVGGRQEGAYHDEHDLRVKAVAEQIAHGGLGVWGTPPGPAAPPPARAVVDEVVSQYLPIAMISSAAAASVHAAVGPAHFREQVLFGLFFAGSALAQILWPILMVRRPTRAPLVAAVIGNTGILALWLVTRTIGLPGLLSAPEAVGPWDLCCGAWELMVVLAAGRVLRTEDPVDLRLAAWSDWKPFARIWTIGSASVLLALTLIGAGS